MIFTFDFYSYLILIPACDVGDYTQVSSLVFCSYVFDLQSPIAVGLKTTPFKISLSVFGPVGVDPWIYMKTHTYCELIYK